MSGDARQALADFRAEGRALTGGGRDYEAYNNALAEAAREALNQSHFGQQSGSEAGRIKLAFAAAADAQSKSEREAESKAKARFNDAVLLAMLAQLEEEIEALEKQIDAYDKQIAAVDWLIENHAVLDPTDPEHMQLLELAGIPKDEWGTVTVEDLQARLEELEAAKDQAKQELIDKREEKDFWAAKVDEYNARAALDPTFDKSGIIGAEIDVRFDEKFRANLEARPQSIDKESAWFKAAVKELKIYERGISYDEKMGILIGTLSQNTKAELTQSDEISDDVIALLKVDKFFEDYERAQAKKEDPRYAEMLEQKLILKLDDNIKIMLRNNPDTPQEVLNIIDKIFQVTDNQNYEQSSSPNNA